jgi:hypothetical protein
MLRDILRRWIRRVGTVLLSLAILGSVAWLVWAMVTERAVRDWLDARAAEGWLVNYADLSVSGYPFDFRTRFTSLELADPDTGWLWTLPAFQLESEAIRPDRIRAVWPEEQRLASPVERLTVNASEITSVLDVRPGADFALDASETMLSDVTVTSDAGWRMALPEGHLTMTRQEGQDTRYDVAFAARDLAPPGPMRGQLDPGGVLPATIETLQYTAEMEFDRPWDLRAIEDRRPQITALDLREMNAVWGGLILRAAGDITVDSAGIPDGAFAIRAENWREMVAMTVRAGLIPEQMQGTVEGLLGVVAGLSGDPEVIDADLRFSNGRTFLGPLPVGPAPRLVLR